MKNAVKDIKKMVRILGMIFRLSVSRFTIYRLTFLFSLGSTFSWLVGMLLFYEGLFGNVDSIAGYSKYEMMLYLGVAQMFAMINFVWFTSRLHLDNLIKSFDLDMYLLKPVNQLLFTTLGYVKVRNLVILGPAIIAFVLGASGVDYTIGIGNWVMFAVALIPSFVAYYLMIVITQLVSFWVVDSEAKYLVNEVHDVLQLPYGLFPRNTIRAVFTYAIPLLLLTNVPFRALRGDLPMEWVVGIIVADIILYIVAQWMWQKGVARYCDVD